MVCLYLIGKLSELQSLVYSVRNKSSFTINLPKDNPVLNVKQKKEVGKPVKGFEKFYEVSNFGRVSNYRKILKTYVINSGYLALKFTVQGKVTPLLVHRLVAEAFIPNPDNKPHVNHKDGNKQNNCVWNLEWVTVSENILHARQIGLNPYNNPTLGKKLGKGSKYRNVTFDVNRRKFIGAVRHNKKTYYQKRFDTEIEAARHVNWILDTLGLHDRPRNAV